MLTRNATIALLAVMPLLLAAEPTKKAKTPIEDLRAKVEALESEVADLKAAIAKLEARLDAAADAPAKAAAPGDPAPGIANAIKANKIVVGMTMAQAEGVFNRAGQVFDVAAHDERMAGGKAVVSEKWSARDWTPGRPDEVIFENGIVVHVKY
jgi:hypothetical protein